MSASTKPHCNNCGAKTNHDVLHEEKIFGPQRDIEDDEEPTLYNVFEWWEQYEILKCRGCENITVRHTSWFPKNGGPEGGKTTVTYYPPRIARRAPYWASSEVTVELVRDWLDDIPGVPAAVCDLMREVYTAVQNGSRRLAAMGIRAALETVMVDRGGDKGNFKLNLDAFQAAGHLSIQQRDTLDAILEAGHAATHRGWVPSDDDITTLLDITESIIESSYMHGHRANALEKKIPKRPPRPEKHE